jgi:type II secretory pathway pseudopilin PulG
VEVDRVRRFALRSLRSDEGLGLVETVVALFVFSLIMAGLAGSMVMFAHSTTLARARASATTLAQQYVEKARAIGATSLMNCDNATPLPPTTTSFHGKTGLTVAKDSSANCIKYQTTPTQDGLTFSVTRLVILTENSKTDIAGQPINEKYLVVQVSWTDAGGATKTYELDTVFNQNGSITAVPAQGIRFVVKDINGNILAADSSSWAISITGGNCTVAAPCAASDATTAEGTYSQVDLAPGSYTCTATRTSDASAGYTGAPSPYNPLMTSVTDASITGPCSVSANTVTDFPTTWKSATDCAQSATTGTVNFTVTDTNNTGLTGMTVTLTNLTDSSKTYTKTSTTGGAASGIHPAADWYTYSVTDPAGNYVADQNSYGPICIMAGQTYSSSPLQVSMSSGIVCAPSSVNGTLTFTVQDSAPPNAKLQGFKVSVTNTSTGTVTAFPNTTAAGVSSKAVKGGPYTYTVTPPSGSSYQGSGVLSLCLAANETKNIPVSLGTASCTRDTGHHGSLSFLVTDQAGTPIQNATISLTNVNGDNLPGGSPWKTGADGTKTIANALVDPYQYKVTGPNSNYLASDTQGPVCVTNGATTPVPTVMLTGLMNVVVTVQNNDIVPWKNYTVSVVDTSGKAAATQYVTVPNCTPNSAGCTRNPSAALTFSKLVAAQYTITVQAGNTGNLVDTAPTQPSSGTTVNYYNFTTPVTTYSVSTPGCSACADLALTDDTGGA